MKGISSPPFALPSRYLYQNKVLRGGQGDVFICRDESLDRLVAIKTLRDTKDAPALVKEIDARAKIKSKHVAEVYDRLVDARGKPTAIVMEYVPGESLEHPSVRPSTREATLSLLYQISCGVEDIHEAGVIHRDIKPLNMKVDGSRVLKIFDLGIANIDASSATTVGGAGTFAFRAPELYRPPVRVTSAADVYALGVMAWWLLANDIPSPLLELPPQSSDQPIPSIATAVSSLNDLADLVDLTLSTDPSRRPSSRKLRACIARLINHAQRRGVFSLSDRVHELAQIGASSRLEIQPYGTLRVTYAKDGRFIVREVTGDVFVNNSRAAVGAELPDSCVLTFGPEAATSARVFIPFDVSQPEIVL